jgi:hypothetical protein
METKNCSFANCNRPHKAKGYCRPHYRQFVLGGVESLREVRVLLPKLHYSSCIFEGCGGKPWAHGLCNAHLMHKRKGKALEPIKRSLGNTTEERFMARVEKIEGGCWLWRGQIHSNRREGTEGYGVITVNKKPQFTHRWAYEKMKSRKLQPEDTLDHLCRNTLCCNPEHLEVVTRSENTLRKNLYQALRSENDRFRKYLKSVGVDPEQVLSETTPD